MGVQCKPPLHVGVASLAVGLLVISTPARAEEPDKLLAKADRLAWLMNWPDARPLFAQAEQLYQESGDTRNALHAKIGRIRADVGSLSYPEVSAYFSDLLDSPILRSDLRLRLRCLTAKASIEIASKPASESRPLWDEVRMLASRLGEKGWEVRASGELGIISFLEGDSTSALTLVGAALKSARASGDVAAQIRYMALVGRALAQFGRHDTGLEYYKRAIRLAEETAGAGFPYIAVLGRGEALLAMNKIFEAKKVFEAALTQANRSQSIGYRVEALTHLGRLHAAIGDREAAKEYLEEAATTATQAQLDRLVAGAMLELAKLYRDGGDTKKAEEYAAMGIQARLNIEDVYLQPSDLAVQADLKRAEGKVQEADALYARATDIIDGMLVRVPTFQARGSLVAAKSDIYVKHFTLAIEQLGDPGKAFQIVERARGRSAADSLRAQPFEMTGEPAKRTPTHTNISSLQLRLRKSESPKDRALLLDAIFEAEQQFKFEAAPVSSRGDPVGLRALQEVLREDEVVFEYVLSEPKSFCLVISNSGLTPVTFNGGRQIQDKVERYLSVIRSGETDRRLGKELFDSLLGPMRAHLEQKSRLIIVPDGNLHWLPFETLVRPDGKYLLQSHVVTAIPSSTVLHLLRTTERQQEQMLPMLAVGAVVYESAGRVRHHRVDTTRGLYDIDGEKFGSLPSTLKEVSELARIAGAKTVLLVGEQATEASFKSQPLSMFKVLHLALHGIASLRYPERAALVFSQPVGAKEDGLLQAWEIGRLSLAADLVTLSACNTGVGRLEGQEGVANLVRAFLFAGARSVAASQWAVDDVFTAALMRRFYTRLAEGLDRASALRMAKLDLIERHGAEITPYYWAAFTLVGEGSMPTEFTR